MSSPAWLQARRKAAVQLAQPSLGSTITSVLLQRHRRLAEVSLPTTRVPDSGANPQIAIVKVTNGSDGPTIITGTTVTWRYTVTNVGNVPLSSVTVTDSVSGVTPAFVSGDTNSNGKLDLTETWIYTATGTAIVGSYSNTGTASGSYTDDEADTGTDTATDLSNYTGKVQVNVIKTVNGKPFSGPDLTFQLRQGAAPVNGQFGTEIETQLANVANNGEITFNTLLSVGTYQFVRVCAGRLCAQLHLGCLRRGLLQTGLCPGAGRVGSQHPGVRKLYHQHGRHDQLPERRPDHPATG